MFQTKNGVAAGTGHIPNCRQKLESLAGVKNDKKEKEEKQRRKERRIGTSTCCPVEESRV
jgi:hypothetical protein